MGLKAGIAEVSSVLERNEKIRDPIHGFIYLSELEREIIDTRAFQRLRRIHQLALTSFVYPGAEHNRFSHSLGVMHLATKVFEAIKKNCPEFSALDEGLQAHLEQVLRLYALLHDVGHGPFSHAGDKIFGEGLQHEDYSSRIVQETEIADIINRIGEKLATQFANKDLTITSELIGKLIAGNVNDPRYFLLKQIMNSEADVDKMDYLLRDSYYCGVTYGHYDLPRLLESFTAIPVSTSSFRIALHEGGLHSFEAFVLARYWMFLQVYFHRTRRIYDYFLHKFFVDTYGTFPQDINAFLELDDYRVWQTLNQKAAEDNQWAKAIVDRGVWKCVFESHAHSPEFEVVEFRFIESALKKKFDPNLFLVDRASKAPHKITISSIEDEDGIPILTNDKKRKSILSESEVIRKISSPISKYRVYAHPNIAEEVKKTCEEQHNTALGIA